jgi:hypothetical protein
MLRSGRLSAANETELSDLGVWLEHHPEEVSEDVRFQAIDFIDQTIDAVESYPCCICVPTHLVDALVGVIEDWTEVLTAHDESFLTNMMVIE